MGGREERLALNEALFREVNERLFLRDASGAIGDDLGGSDDIANLFPERLYAHPDYRVKDRLENKLHDLVCSGEMWLRYVQRQIAGDW